MTDEETIWHGADGLTSGLCPLAELEPFPDNPRRGDIGAVTSSLRRFGQLKPIVVDGHRIVAGHHVVRAAQELAWTHVAVVDHTFQDADEQRAFLLADNRTSDLGDYNLEALTQQVAILAELDALDGTGYSRDDLDGYLAELVELQKLSEVPAPPPDPATFPTPPSEALQEVVLLYSVAQREQLEVWLNMIAKANETDGISETFYVAARTAALASNQGAAPSSE